MSENRQATTADMTPMQTIVAMENVLDKLPDASGRTKCGYIWILAELTEHMKSFFMEPHEEPGIKFEVVKEEPQQTKDEKTE